MNIQNNKNISNLKFKIITLTFAFCLLAFSPAVSAQTTIPASVNYRRVFVTSTQQTGNLGGLSGADTICQTRANAAGLGGTWKTWLSTSTTSPASRLEHFNGPYKLVNGTTIANNWTDLVDGTLLAPINLSEFGGASSGWVFTQTNSSGDPWSGSMCQDSTFGGDNGDGVVGNRTAINAFWSQANGGNICNFVGGIYCFEQASTPTPTPTPSPSPTPTPTPKPSPTPIPTSTPTSTSAPVTTTSITKHEISGNATLTNIQSNDLTDSIFHITGNLTISASQSSLLERFFHLFTAFATADAHSRVVFEDENLNIDTNYCNSTTVGSINCSSSYPIDPLTGTVFVVKGDVIIDPTVTRIDAVIISYGTIYTAGNNCSFATNSSTNPQLVINGSLISLTLEKPIQFCRKLTDNTEPAEKINHQVKYLVILRDLMSDTLQKWSEVP